MKKKVHQMNQKQIKTLLNESLFNPKLPGPMKIVAEISNLDYFKCKAIELIKQSSFSSPQDCLRDAISILILARCYLDDQTKIQNTDGKDPSGIV